MDPRLLSYGLKVLGLDIYPKEIGNREKESQVCVLSCKQEGSNEEVDMYKVQFTFKEIIISLLFYK